MMLLHVAYTLKMEATIRLHVTFQNTTGFIVEIHKEADSTGTTPLRHMTKPTSSTDSPEGQRTPV
jgi:hypothetical protein